MDQPTVLLLGFVVSLPCTPASLFSNADTNDGSQYLHHLLIIHDSRLTTAITDSRLPIPEKNSPLAIHHSQPNIYSLTRKHESITFDAAIITHMNLPIYIVDAFTSKLFGGNPAAVCPLEEWLPDNLMQSLAAENNLAETVFFVKEANGYRIRWFTPSVEVKLCGHATLASAHIMYTELGYDEDEIVFDSLSGPLKVKRTSDGKIQLDFPASSLEALTGIPQAIKDGLHIDEATVFKTSFDYMVVLPSQAAVESLQPDLNAIATLSARGVIVTAKGDEADFVSRCFFPQSGINEDPVTGSAHTAMVPYWAGVLDKNKLKAIQVSKRRGYLDCELAGDRVLMSGNAVTYSRGNYTVSGEW